ncbi:DNA adenine methylase [Kribbella sp. NPDC003505]|uniref:DNA adenine methylase n=1 Tax=Kribbella sp. NPDC003505 TaxID=3154448 RepID=UPI0033B13468
MIQRYLGNKGRVLGQLLAVFGGHAERGDHVVDLFSGSLAVSMAMKAAGYRVSANDANLLSYVIGEAFLVPSTVPEADLSLLPAEHRDRLLAESRRHVRGATGFDVSVAAGRTDEASSLHALAAWLNEVTVADLPTGAVRFDIFNTYSEDGERSEFTSLRGSTGRRRFFSGANARRIDLALSQLRLWARSGRLDEPVRAYLLASLMRAVEKVANTQGTFHDFPRDKWDQRALNPIRIEGLPTDPMLSDIAGHRVGKAEDSRDFVKTLEPHKILYLDPPYNFRQYSAYYFLLNLLCRYTDIDDLEDYFSKVTYVRGQNPEDDFVSTFCRSSSFLSDMGAVMRDAAAETVVVSYYTGRNHWSDFDRGRDDTGLNLLRELMTGSMFDADTFEALEVDRLNYASYGGYRARTVQELILVAKKRKGDSDARGSADGGIPEVA